MKTKNNNVSQLPTNVRLLNVEKALHQVIKDINELKEFQHQVTQLIQRGVENAKQKEGSQPG